MPVLYGVFLYMGASSLKGIQVKWIYEECITDDTLSIKCVAIIITLFYYLLCIILKECCQP